MQTRVLLFGMKTIILIGFNKLYGDIFKNNMLSEPKIGINFGQSYEEASKKPEFILAVENI